MAVLKPFKGIRPKKEFAKQVASRPYDVLDTKEARKEAEGNPLSFYHVIKPEIDFPDAMNPYAPEIYERGKANFAEMMSKGIFARDEKDCLYIYAQKMSGRMQYGIVGCASVQDYLDNVIRKHELTRPDKEEDRKKHVRISGLNYEPVFFAYPYSETLEAVVKNVTTDLPEYDFETADGIGHFFWVIRDDTTIRTIVDAFSKIRYTYVADGHHRTAAAALVGKERKDANPNHTGQEEYNYFLAVHFPDNQLQILDYNRVVKDLNGKTASAFMDALTQRFRIKKQEGAYRPQRLHEFGMYLEGNWYSLEALPGTFNDKDPIGALDVTLLSEQVLAPLLNITDLRTDKRIEFVGGLRGLGELERRVDSGEMKAAFALHPVSMKQLIDIADSGLIMPPKVTWFEPKLRSGLVLHSLDES